MTFRPTNLCAESTFRSEPKEQPWSPQKAPDASLWTPSIHLWQLCWTPADPSSSVSSGFSRAEEEGLVFMQLSGFMWHACEASGLFVGAGLMTPVQVNPPESPMTLWAQTQVIQNRSRSPNLQNFKLDSRLRAELVFICISVCRKLSCL